MRGVVECVAKILPESANLGARVNLDPVQVREYFKLQGILKMEHGWEERITFYFIIEQSCSVAFTHSFVFRENEIVKRQCKYYKTFWMRGSNSKLVFTGSARMPFRFGFFSFARCGLLSFFTVG